MEQFDVFPHGLSLGQGAFRAAMIFKNKKETEVLPIWLDSAEANLLIASSQGSSLDFSPHRGSLKIMDRFHIQLESVDFNQVEGLVQYAEVLVSQGEKKLKVKMRASDAISLGLNSGCTFVTNKNMVAMSRTLEFPVTSFEQPRDPSRAKKGVEELH